MVNSERVQKITSRPSNVFGSCDRSICRSILGGELVIDRLYDEPSVSLIPTMAANPLDEETIKQWVAYPEKSA